MRIVTVHDKEGVAVLWTPAAAVENFDGQTRGLAGRMIQTMRAHKGLGLAAPQVGVSLRLCVTGLGSALVLVNPEVIERHGEQDGKEGCLSIPGFERRVVRAYQATVRYFDRKGHEKVLRAEGEFARLLQHEIDHLNGILIGGPS